jgi:hypothetical protein
MSRSNAPPRPHCYRKPLRPALSQHPRTTTALGRRHLRQTTSPRIESIESGKSQRDANEFLVMPTVFLAFEYLR